MNYQFSFRFISQQFLHPVVTNHGIWKIRDSIILRLIDYKGRVGWGEISPISWFGSETLEQALEFCQQLPKEITKETIVAIPDYLPTCQFGFESAWENLASNGEFSTPQDITFSGLLPAGEVALNRWYSLWEQGYRTFKWKIGVQEVHKELEIFQSLIRSLPDIAKLRLDANCGLSYREAQLWLQASDQIYPKIEFLEQPLPIDKFTEMQKLSREYQTAIALDESVANFQQLEHCLKQGWSGIFVIKPGIFGSPSRLRQLCQQQQIDLVFSSVFETEIGRQAALKLAGELSTNNRAVGFGINHFFTLQAENWPNNLW
ncbi:MAG TPA: o-succinylbenzoate synthase [Nostocaceae cyanobacterium]|nr:o-succinylbenzoate synthase [Nostocaceae cyanobacterium]